MIPDAVVVGAGPAGAAAAYVLARAGLRVRLLDRVSFPRHKLCGDTINPGALAILDGFALAPTSGGAEPGLRTIGHRVRQEALPISGMLVTGPGGAQVTGAYPAHARGAALTRATLDGLLLEAAVGAGAAFDSGACVLSPHLRDGRVAGVRVAGVTGEYVLPARIVIAADGRGSRVAAPLRIARFAARPRRWAFGTYFEGVSGVGTCGEMHVREGRYIGVAPLPGGVTNVCVVRELAPGAHMSANERPRVVQDAVEAEPVLRDRFAAARQVSPLSTLGPLAVDARSAGAPGLLLAGDAAGFIDPMTGDGLRFALRGGVLAAEAALQELGSGRPAYAALGAARRREFGSKWRIDRAVRFVAGSPHALGCLAATARRWGVPVKYLIRLAGDLDLVPARGEPGVSADHSSDLDVANGRPRCE